MNKKAAITIGVIALVVVLGIVVLSIYVVQATPPKVTPMPTLILPIQPSPGLCINHCQNANSATECGASCTAGDTCCVDGIRGKCACTWTCAGTPGTWGTGQECGVNGQGTCEGSSCTSSAER